MVRRELLGVQKIQVQKILDKTYHIMISCSQFSEGAMMKLKCFIELLSFILFFTILNSSSWAGQVVTEDVRLWAKQALKEEKAIKAVEVRNTLAVLYFQNKTGQSQLASLQKGMTLMLITDLSQIKGIQVVERVKLQALVEELGLGVSGLVESTTTPRVGKLLGAQWLVGGDILAGQQTQLQIQSNLLDVPDEKILGQSMAEGQLSELFRLEKDILFATVKLLNIRLTPEEEARVRKPCSTNTDALIELFKGIDASDRGNYDNAAEFYELGLKKDPNICMAAEALKELKTLGLIAVQKKSLEVLKSLRNETSLTDQLSPEDATKRERTPNDIRTRETPVDIIIHFP